MEPMEPNWKRIRLAYFALAMLALANGGCLVATAGAVGGAALGYAYVKGKVHQEYNAGLGDTWAATQAALTDLGMPIVHQELNRDSGLIVSRTSEGERIQIDLGILQSPIPVEGLLTQVGIRVATFGDQALSERILLQVGVHLSSRPALASGSTSPSPVPVQPVPTWGSSGRTSTPPAQPINPAGFVPPQSAEPPLLPPKP